MDVVETIPVLLASDNHYAVMIAALIKSIELNHVTNENIIFTIIDDGISKANKDKIQKSIISNLITIRWIKPKDVIPAGMSVPMDTSVYPITVYLRLFAPYAIGLEHKKLLYLDVDMILYDDISKLYNHDIGNYILGAVQDYMPTFNHPRAIPNYKELGIPAETKYFNSGLMLINSQKWVEEDVANKVIECMNNNKVHIIYPDQYGLNVVLYNKWLEIDRTWNCSALFNDPAIPSLIHFIDIKPIFTSYYSLPKHKEEFFRLLKLTAFKGFKPYPDYKRLFKKGYTKIKKIILNSIANIRLKIA
ncbi:MAG: glycosyltransferase family 8 protein [Rickettsiales bacterium]|nr:MAG: glycosyltransferase family 8 protein [Rickettsiales bacterium]